MIYNPLTPPLPTTEEKLADGLLSESTVGHVQMLSTQIFFTTLSLCLSDMHSMTFEPIMLVVETSNVNCT